MIILHEEAGVVPVKIPERRERKHPRPMIAGQGRRKRDDRPLIVVDDISRVHKKVRPQRAHRRVDRQAAGMVQALVFLASHDAKRHRLTLVWSRCAFEFARLLIRLAVSRIPAGLHHEFIVGGRDERRQGMHDDAIAFHSRMLPRSLGPRGRPFDAKAHPGLARGGGRSAGGGTEVQPRGHVHGDASVGECPILSQGHGLSGLHLERLDPRQRRVSRIRRRAQRDAGPDIGGGRRHVDDFETGGLVHLRRHGGTEQSQRQGDGQPLS